LPDKHVNIIPEEGDEHKFLFVAQVPPDVGSLDDIRVELDDLHKDILIIQGLHAECRR
jgi:hypothetical protein